ncbi:cyanate hydratase [Rhizoctonia solani AG-3 Rhs1AP]|uniref:Cyanate hydratase n=2 Tax=Rhizoctonia solani AG-3 TaxID=1086053 RepID=A0A074SHR3_9AGAM|nr:cyanate hydratase [Rhizoctonia solani AG-3 Rhs1AP]KEP49562.1 cyanate hydratase [Rhizoctonia solani 123E]
MSFAQIFYATSRGALRQRQFPALTTQTRSAVRFSSSSAVSKASSPVLPGLPSACKQLFDAKAKKGLSFGEIGEAIGKDEIWTAALFYGQAKPAPEDLSKLSEALGVPHQSLKDSLGDHWWPTRGLGPDPPQDPVIYRLHEGVLVYGYPIKVSCTKFGDGIMSLIDCHVTVDRKPHEKGDRVVLTFDGKFLPYAKW